MDDDDDDDDDDQTYGGVLPPTAATTNGRVAATTAGGKASQKKPETEEEKRRNFLERNRQGMLSRRSLPFPPPLSLCEHCTDGVLAFKLPSSAASARRSGCKTCRPRSSS